MPEMSHVSVKVESWSSSRLSLSCLYFIYVIKSYVCVHAQENYAKMEINP